MAPPTPPPGIPPPPKDEKPKASGGLFASKPKETGPAIPDLADVIKDLNGLNRRLRVLEERYTNLRKKTQVTDQNMLMSQQKVTKQIQAIHEDIHILNLEMTNVKNKMNLLVKELQLLAKREEVDVLKHYVEMWDPLNFITSAEAEKLITTQVENKMDDINLRMQQENYIREQIQNELDEMINERIKYALSKLTHKKNA